MKIHFNIIRITMLSLGLSLLMLFKVNAQVGIGTSSPEASAKLDVTSATKGFLLPRITYDQRTTMTPTNGLQVYCTNCGSGTLGEMQIYNGTSWVNAAGAAASGLASLTYTQRNALEPSAAASGLSVWCSDCNSGAGETSVFDGTQWRTTAGALANMAPPFGGTAICDGTRPTVVKDVTHTYNGVTYTWMDRNLGASRAATVYNDYLAYGCSYQWGRGNDGHASINWTSSSSGVAANGVTTTLSNTTSPGNALYINAGTDGSVSWMTSAPNPETRWQGGVNALNNPCPAGYRIPTSAEINAMMNNIYNVGTNANSWPNAITKLPVAGNRLNGGSIVNMNVVGIYHTSNGNLSVNSTSVGGSQYIYANNSLSVRCIKN
jgi:hypothetical protein